MLFVQQQIGQRQKHDETKHQKSTETDQMRKKEQAFNQIKMLFLVKYFLKIITSANVDNLH